MKGRKMQYRYRCSSEGEVNNGLKKSCEFEHAFDEGTYHCPLCASIMIFVPNARSVSQLLQAGARKEKDKGQ
jgi:hypothetical protein